MGQQSRAWPSFRSVAGKSFSSVQSPSTVRSLRSSFLTSWLSNPKHVYSTFDEIARKKKIFKVYVKTRNTWEEVDQSYLTTVLLFALFAGRRLEIA